MILFAQASQAAVWYVDKDNVSGTEDGTSWTTAFTTIQPAIDAAFNDAGGEVWVAQGVYGEERTSPNADGSGEDTGSIVMKVNVHLYGGFVGTETARSDRDWEANLTTLEGTSARSGSPAYHVIVGADNAILDGFFVTGGKAISDPYNLGIETGYGAGMYNNAASPQVVNCTFTGNECLGPEADGGAIYNRSSRPRIFRCQFIGNSAANDGGAIANFESSPILISCLFSENIAGGQGGAIRNFASFQNPSNSSISSCEFFRNFSDHGGAIYSHRNTLPVFTNSVFRDNEATSRGGAVVLDNSWASFSNCVFFENSATEGGGAILVSLSDPSITNSIIWGNSTETLTLLNDANPSIEFSIIQGGFVGEGNLDAEPLFTDPATGDFRLRIGSPAIDTGTSVNAPSTDIDGNPRPIDFPSVGIDGIDEGFDMGAYEMPRVLFVDRDNTSDMEV